MSEKSERKPNTDQLKVINELDSNLILFASAGTGKTFLVAQRVKHIIETGRALPGRNRGRFSVMTEKQRMTYNVPGDEYGENSKSSGRQRDLPCDAAGITGKGYSKTTRNAYGEPSPVHPAPRCQPPEENFRINMWPFIPQAGRTQDATAAAEV